MALLDRYICLNDNLKRISASFITSGKKGVWLDYLKPLTFEGGAIKSVAFIEGYGSAIRDKIKKQFGITFKKHSESFAVQIENEQIKIYAEDDIAFIYAVSALMHNSVGGRIGEGLIYNYPSCKFRGLKVYLPSAENISYFYSMIDFALMYGLNKIVIEVGGAMEYKRHPEINDGWIEYSKLFRDYPGKSIEYQISQGSLGFPKNAIHWENGGGNFISQNEVKKLVSYCKKRGIEAIPEAPLMSHCDYVLYNRRELAERPDDKTPDAYCPSHPETYKLVFDILDEIIEIFEPGRVHIGHDELYTVGVCGRCKGKNPAKLYAGDIEKIRLYLAGRNIKTIIWGDKILDAADKRGNGCGGAGHTGYKDTGEALYYIPPIHESVGDISSDVQIFHWYWFVNRRFDEQIVNNGFYTVYGNFHGPFFCEWDKRKTIGVKGYCVSNWALLSGELMQRNGVWFDFAYGAYMYWSGKYGPNKFEQNIIDVASHLFKAYNYQALTKPHVEIIHTAEAEIKRGDFVDGNFPNKETERLGEYVLTFADGKKIKVPVYFGGNIAFSGRHFKSKDSEAYDCVDFYNFLFETTGMCDYIKSGNKLYYKIVVPYESRLTRWEYKLLKKDVNVETMSVKCVVPESTLDT